MRQSWEHRASIQERAGDALVGCVNLSNLLTIAQETEMMLQADRHYRNAKLIRNAKCGGKR